VQVVDLQALLELEDVVERMIGRKSSIPLDLKDRPGLTLIENVGALSRVALGCA
jgi:hypothetical protein